MICLCYQELNLIERVLKNSDPLPVGLEEDMEEGDWGSEITKDRKISEILG